MIPCLAIHLIILVRFWLLMFSMVKDLILGRELFWKLYLLRTKLVSLMEVLNSQLMTLLFCLNGKGATILLHHGSWILCTRIYLTVYSIATLQLRCGESYWRGLANPIKPNCFKLRRSYQLFHKKMLILPHTTLDPKEFGMSLLMWMICEDTHVVNVSVELILLWLSIQKSRIWYIFSWDSMTLTQVSEAVSSWRVLCLP